MSDTELLNAKINAGFDHLDADGDGHLSEQDHVLLGRRMSAELGHAPGSEQEQRVTESFLRIWREVHLPHVPEGATAISRAGFLDSVNALAADPDARAAVAAMAETYLSIVDTDGDGRVSPAEFRVFQRAQFAGLTDEDMDEAFAHLDVDGNGYLSAAEFVRGFVEFWSSTDPAAPGNWWMGRPARTG